MEMRNWEKGTSRNEESVEREIGGKGDWWKGNWRKEKSVEREIGGKKNWQKGKWRKENLVKGNGKNLVERGTGPEEPEKSQRRASNHPCLRSLRLRKERNA